jgi:hypothetical protein
VKQTYLCNSMSSVRENSSFESVPSCPDHNQPYQHSISI